MKHWTDFLVNLMEEFAIKFVHQLHFSAILINSKFHFLKTVNGHFVCRHRGLYTGIQDGIQAHKAMKSLNIFYKQTTSKLRELHILGDSVVPSAAVLLVSTNCTLSSILFLP